MDAEDRELFAAALAKLVDVGDRDGLDDALADVGWLDALVEDRRVATSTWFELQGKALARSAALDFVFLDALGAPLDAMAAVVLPPIKGTTLPGIVDGDRLLASGVGTVALSRSTTAVVAIDDGIARVPTSTLNCRSVEGVDPAFGCVVVEASDLGHGEWSREESSSWPAALGAGRLALAHELVGASRAMLDLAREHVLARVQFGRAVSSFQAVRHKLAEALVAIEAADAATSAAWDDGTPFAGTVAKAVAGRSAKIVVRHCQQALAGIGFTIDHPFHGYVRRVAVLDRLLGSSNSLTREVGVHLLETGRVPAGVPLFGS